jgi:8-oxo-dGTP pyrophosphatase MutT (NUDIX family)
MYLTHSFCLVSYELADSGNATKPVSSSTKGRNIEREVTSVAMLLKARLDGQDRYLLRYNDNWNAYNFVAGKCEATDPDATHAALREIEEELGLKAETDVSVQKLLQFDHEDFSDRYQKLTLYHWHLFEMLLAKPIAAFNAQLMADSKNRWVTYEELKNGVIGDGHKIGDIVKTFIEKIEEKYGGIKELPCAY